MIKSWIVPAMLGAVLMGCQANAQGGPDSVAGKPALPRPPLAGGWTAQSPTSAMIQEASKEALSLLRSPEWLRDTAVSLKAVERAETQVVAGLNTRLAMTIERRGVARGVDVLLYQPLQGTSSLSSLAIAAPGSAGTFFESPAARAMPGGFTEQKPDAELQAIAQKACQLVASADWLGDSTLAFSKLQRAMTQVVAGMNYYLEMEARSAAGTRSVQVLLYRDLKGNDTLTWMRLGGVNSAVEKK